MDDLKVQTILASLGLPKILPEESEESRANRLREALQSVSSDSSESSKPSDSSKIVSVPALLLQSRHTITAYSLKRSKERLEKERKQSKKENNPYSPIGSMFCDERLPMGLSLENNTIAIAGWSGSASL